MKHVHRTVLRTGLLVLCGLLIPVVAATPATPTETLDSAHEGVSAPWRQRDTKEPCVHPLQNLHWTKWVLNHTGISFLSYYLLVQQNYPPLVSQVVVVIRNHFMHVLVRIGSLQSMHRSVGAFLQGVASHLIFGSGPDMYFDGHLRPSVCQVMKSDLHSSTFHAHPLAPSFWISLLRNLGVASYLYQAGSLFSIVLHIYLGTFLLEMSPHNRAASSKYSKGRRRFPTLLKRPARWLFYFLKTHPMSLVFLAGAIPWPFFNPLPLLVVFIIKLHTLRAHWRTLLAAILVSRLLIIPLVSLMGTVLSVWMGANNAFLLCDDIKNPASLSSNLLKSKNIQTVVVQELRLVSAIGTLIAGIGVCISLRDLKESSSHE